MKTRRGPDWSNPGQGLACFLAADPPRGAQSDPNPDAYALCLNCGKRIEHHYGGTAYRCERIDDKEHSNENVARLKEGLGPEYIVGEPQQCSPPGFDGGVRYYLPADLVIDTSSACVWLESFKLDQRDFLLFKLSGGWVLELSPCVRTGGKLYITQQSGSYRRMIWADRYMPPTLDTSRSSGDLQFDKNRGQPTEIRDVGLITSRVEALENRLQRCERMADRIERLDEAFKDNPWFTATPEEKALTPVDVLEPQKQEPPLWCFHVKFADGVVVTCTWNEHKWSVKLPWDEGQAEPTDAKRCDIALRQAKQALASVQRKPAVPTGCATIVLKYIDGRIHVLLGKRRGSHGAGEWSFPGGRLEPGEAPQERAAIELDEETGISCFAHQLRTLREQPFSATLAGGESWVTLFFVMVVGATQTAEVREPDKCFEWRWFCWDDPPTPLFGACEPIMRDVGETELKAYISTDK